VTGAVANTRGSVAVDYRPDSDTTVRIIATHLEVTSGGGGPIQQRQADELLARVAASPYPVIVLGDFNAPAGRSATYAAVAGVLYDAWSRARPADPGPTCCQSELLDNPTDRTDRRIDLVLSSENWPVDRVEGTGTRPFRSSPPLWASDHFGVTARFKIS
jgi:endonuclease/exonuclease/phosphatase family metal-dependent hydrolase